MSTVTFGDGIVRLDVKPSAVLDARDMMSLFDAVAEHLREIGVDCESFSLSLNVEYLDQD